MECGQIDRSGHVIDIDRHKGKVNIIEQEFASVEREEEERRREEEDIRRRVRVKRHEAIEHAQRAARMAKIREDRRIRSEIIRIARGELLLGTGSPANSASHASLRASEKAYGQSGRPTNRAARPRAGEPAAGSSASGGALRTAGRHATSAAALSTLGPTVVTTGGARGPPSSMSVSPASTPGAADDTRRFAPTSTTHAGAGATSTTTASAVSATAAVAGPASRPSSRGVAFAPGPSARGTAALTSTTSASASRPESPSSSSLPPDALVGLASLASLSQPASSTLAHGVLRVTVRDVSGVPPPPSAADLLGDDLYVRMRLTGAGAVSPPEAHVGPMGRRDPTTGRVAWPLAATTLSFPVALDVEPQLGTASPTAVLTVELVRRDRYSSDDILGAGTVRLPVVAALGGIASREGSDVAIPLRNGLIDAPAGAMRVAWLVDVFRPDESDVFMGAGESMMDADMALHVGASPAGRMPRRA